MTRRLLRWGCWGLIALLATLGGAAARPTPVAGGEMFTGYFPIIHRSIASVPLALVNPSFENEQWGHDEFNQIPAGWDYYTPAKDEAMPFAKFEGGQLVPALSDGPGEYVHKYWWQLPQDEWQGGPRALILHGNLVYKAFGFQKAQALRLSQTLTGIPGEYLRVTGYILGETHEAPPLADDNFIASVQLGSVADTRVYGIMIQNHDVPGNERAWNRFQVTAQVPASGQLTLTIIVQQNFPNSTDFFLDNFSAERLLGAP